MRELSLRNSVVQEYGHALSERTRAFFPVLDRRAAYVRAERWSNLPKELLVSIACMHVADELAASTARAREAICTMRLVSRGMCAVVDRFVGAQLQHISESCATCFWPEPNGARGPSPALLGARVRALGMHPEDALRLSLCRRAIPAREHTADSMPPIALPNCASIVPDWTAYLRRRAERETQHGARSVVVKPTETASAGFRGVVHKLCELNPYVNGARYSDNDTERNDDVVDGAALAAGELDVRMQMLDVACVS